MTVVNVALDSEIGFTRFKCAGVDRQAGDAIGSAPTTKRTLPVTYRLRSTVSRSCDLAFERGFDRLVIGERQHAGAHDLTRLMALAGDKQHIAILQLFDGRANGRGAITDVARTRRGGKNRRANGFGLLATRIVVGDDDIVGLGGSNLAHQRTLAGITVAAATEHKDEPTPRERSQRFQRLGQRVGLVGIVDEDRCAIAFADALQPAGRAVKIFKRGKNARGVAASRNSERG